MRLDPVIDAARAEQRAAQAWYRAQFSRVASLKAKLLAAELDCDTARVIQLKTELEAVRATARQAAEDSAGFRKIARSLGG